MRVMSARLATLTCLAIAPMLCLADSKAVEAAQTAVRRAVRTHLGVGYRVAFEEPKEDILSFTEEVISGVGHATQANSWQFDSSFTYKIKVKFDGSQTRDLIITFDNGNVKKESSNWERADHSDDFVHLTKPGWYQTLSNNNVVFEGEAYGPVTITVFDRDNRKIGDTTTTARNGRFSKSMRLPNGVFRAQVQPSLSLDWDEVRFSVNSYTDDWGMAKKPKNPSNQSPESVVTIRQPGNGRTVNGPRVTIAGDCSERSVRVEIWDSRNNRIVDKDVSTRNGSFSTDVNLGAGDYRLLVESASGRDSDAWRFSVATATNLPNNPGPGVEDIVRINQPSNGGTVNGRVTIAGDCSERSVRVQVWDARNNKVLDRNVPTRNNYWNTQAALPDGDYRMTVDSESGRDSDAWNFRVRGVGGGNGGSNNENPGGSVEDIVQILSPREDATVGSAHTIAGRSSESSVNVTVYDPSNRTIYDSRVSVSGGNWSVTVRDMKKGSYRLVVRSGSGRDTDAIRFSVK